MRFHAQYSNVIGYPAEMC